MAKRYKAQIRSVEMFNLIFNRYKLDILSSNIWKSIKELKLYEKIFLVEVILGVIASLVFSILEYSLGSLISVGIIIVSFIVVFIMRSLKKEKRRIVYESIEPYVNERVKKFINLLKEFKIDIENEENLDMLIELARKEQERYDVWKGLRNLFKGISTYVFIPIITIFLAEFFKDNDPWKIIMKAVVLLLICAAIVFVLYAFASNVDGLFNADKNRLDYFIRDIEEVKVFRTKIKEISKEL